MPYVDEGRIRKFVLKKHARKASSVRLVNKGVIMVTFRDGTRQHYWNNSYNYGVLSGLGVLFYRK